MKKIMKDFLIRNDVIFPFISIRKPWFISNEHFKSLGLNKPFTEEEYTSMRVDLSLKGNVTRFDGTENYIKWVFTECVD